MEEIINSISKRDYSDDFIVINRGKEKILAEKFIQIDKTAEGNFLFIDGDHTYEGVKKDFEMYRPLVKKGGLITFHDIVSGPAENVGGVPRFWKEVLKNFNHKEFVKAWDQNGYGIGVIYK